MNAKLLSAALLIGSSSLVHAAPVEYLTLDQSTLTLIDQATALAIWKAQMPDALTLRLSKLYKPSRWGFLSQVQGGFTDSKICVVTARAALLPRRTLGGFAFKPEKMATTFDALPNATGEQCKALARAKLTQAVTSVIGSLTAK